MNQYFESVLEGGGRECKTSVCVCVYNLIFNYFVQVLVFFFFFFWGIILGIFCLCNGGFNTLYSFFFFFFLGKGGLRYRP